MMSLIMYGIIIAIAVFAMWLDRQDWECPDLYSDRSECREGIGMPIRNTEPEDGDTACKLLSKIARASEAERQNVKWRQSLYLSIGICFAIFGLIATPGTLPKWPVFYTSVGITFLMLYMHFNWYSYHRYAFAEKHVKSAIGKLNGGLKC